MKKILVDERQLLAAEMRAALAQDEQDTAVHMTHCNQGEWEGVCKYGEEDCPALAQQEQEQEPVAYLYSTIAGFVNLHRVKPIGHAKSLYSQALLEHDMKGAREYPNAHSVVALYTTPPRREWRGLSEEEIADAQDAAAIQFRKSRHGVRGQQLMPSDSADWWLARAIEAALKEKNA